MAPEAFDGKRNEQTDIWSVGVIFYQLLAGYLPFQEQDITSLVGAILMRNPESLPSNVPKPLQNVIAHALAKDPNVRYKSATEMRLALRNPHETDSNFQSEKSVYTVQSPVNTMPPQPVHLQPEKKSNTPHFIYAIAGLLAVVIIVGELLWMLNSKTKEITTKESSTPTISQSKTTTPHPTPFSKQITIPAKQMWFDTEIDVTGKSVRIEYVSGQWSSCGEVPLYSDGRGAGSWNRLLVPSAPFRSLVGKTDKGSFFVGNLREGNLGQGRLYLSINDVPPYYDDNIGSLTVKITVSE